MTEEFQNPFKAKGNWYKGNLHCHTKNSDGLVAPEEMVKIYRKKGYNFLSITDHWKVTEVDIKPDKNFILIPGEEVDVGTSEAKTTFHIVGFNLKKPIPFPPKGQHSADPQATIDEIRKNGGEAFIAHPYWSALTVNDMLSVNNHLGMEVYNTNCEVSISKGNSKTHWDDMLAQGRKLLGFAVDDCHSYSSSHMPDDTACSFIMVKTENLNPDSITEAIRKGNFYSSSGPLIKDFEFDGKKIKIHCPRSKFINIVCRAGWGERFTAIKGFIDEVEYKIRGEEKYIRIECVQEDGLCAWTNPVWL